MIVALDISTKCGWACSDGRSGVFNLARHDDYGVMGAELRSWLRILLSRATVCVIERPFVGSKNQYIVNGLVFLAHSVCAEMKVPRAEVGPSSWRKAILGNGRMQRTEAKARAIAWCQERGLSPQDDNHADALCILAWAENCIQRPCTGIRRAS